jgi:hypothetical protein
MQATLCLLRISEPYVGDGSNFLTPVFFVFSLKIRKSVVTTTAKNVCLKPFQVYQSLSPRPMSITKALIFVIRVARIFFRVFKLPRGQVQEVLIESRQRTA